MEYVSLAFGESIHGGIFVADDFKKDNLDAPITLFMPDALLDLQGKLSSHTEYALSEAFKYQSLVPSIIVSNYNEVVVFFPPNRKAPRVLFERVCTT
ncbi:hypothetical protein BDN70DRAFT_314636 [Pholiota conissans]|uniref:Uncharacterized protein n=1 Tax=Pholiota conissans TaxID=109636 RepID=A0A9P5YS05_9AGAR|nr:hypothetical protein BDN70DRAFT_314636 [Pholiota conissans]